MKVRGEEGWTKWYKQRREQVTFNSQMWAEVGEKERESKRKSGEQQAPNKSVRRRRKKGGDGDLVMRGKGKSKAAVV